jgi:alanyl-tRNA synthetase
VTSDEIRQAFLRFFEEKGHNIIPSSPLVPQGDPTLLFTTAGMVQFKPYFLGEAIPPNPRLASCQKCFRTTDIDSVGDAGHLTFFEMLGNFSVGDYFKREAIAWAWEFVIRHLNLPPERLWITIFLDDDEAFNCWQEVGVPAERILRFGEKDNFWGPAGDSGPCGPCSEIHYDFGEGFGCGESGCQPGCECGRFLEIWNLVFTQFNQDREGCRTPLPKPNIDTGMGLERTAVVMQGKVSVYETDLFAPLVARIAEITRRNYGKDAAADHAIRVIAEHARGIVFLIADGVLPGNEGQGYVLRRVLRRAALFGRKLGQEGSFLRGVMGEVIARMGHVYPELVKNRDLILEVAELEEGRFARTLDTGLDLLNRIMAEEENQGRKRLSGSEVFTLYDTYGFPRELTAEVAAERGFSLDLEGFEVEMDRQRERARAANKFVMDTKASQAYEQLGIRSTRFVGYDRLEQESVVAGLILNGELVQTASQGQEVEVVLLETPFYGEMGGQAGDSGEIRSPRGKVRVVDTRRPLPELIVHQGKIVEGSLSVGDVVSAEVDAEHRLDIARNHTATHLLQAALRQVLGQHVYQRGSLVTPERLRFDFTHSAALAEEELAQVQHIVNEQIRKNLNVESGVRPYKEALEEGAMALFGEKYGDEVRVVFVGDPGPGRFSAELCGGTHVRSTGEIGFSHITTESGIGAGIRRLEAVTGRMAEKFIESNLFTLEAISRELGGSPADAQDRLAAIMAELEKERKHCLSLERELSRSAVESLLDRVEMVNGVRVLAAEVTASSMPALREMGDLLREKLKSGVMVLGTIYDDKPSFIALVTADLVAHGFHAGEIVKQVAKVTGGGGGGRAGLAEAGGKDRNKLGEALKLVKPIVQKLSPEIKGEG